MAATGVRFKIFSKYLFQNIFQTFPGRSEGLRVATARLNPGMRTTTHLLLLLSFLCWRQAGHLQIQDVDASTLMS